MTETYATYCPATSPDTTSVISSRDSGAGRTRCDSPDGTDRAGPDRVRADLSPRQASVLGLLTSGTYGRPGNGTSGSSDLALFLGNKLRALLDMNGSILFSLTWKERATPAGRRFFLLRASALRMVDIDCGSLPTPTAKANMLAPSMQKWRAHRNLVFPTPTANRWDGLQSHGRNVVTGGLNPAWVSWLMGFPRAWISYAPSETVSFQESARHLYRHIWRG